MGFFSDLKEDLNQAVNELLPDGSKGEPKKVASEEDDTLKELKELEAMLHSIDEIQEEEATRIADEEAQVRKETEEPFGIIAEESVEETFAELEKELPEEPVGEGMQISLADFMTMEDSKPEAKKASSKIIWPDEKPAEEQASEKKPVTFEGNDMATASEKGSSAASSSNDEASETASSASDKASETASSASDKVSETASSASDKASETASSASDKVSETASSASDKVSEAVSSAGDIASTAASASSDMASATAPSEKKPAVPTFMSAMAAPVAARTETDDQRSGGMEMETKAIDKSWILDLSNMEEMEETAVITAGMRVKGDILSNGSADVFGEVYGNVQVKGKLNVTGKIAGNSKAADILADAAKINGDLISDGEVKIGVGTVVVGNVEATDAVIAGAVKGTIDVKGPVIIDTTAVVLGNVKAKSIQINNGARIEGMCVLCYAEQSAAKFFEEQEV